MVLIKETANKQIMAAVSQSFIDHVMIKISTSTNQRIYFIQGIDFSLSFSFSLFPLYLESREAQSMLRAFRDSDPLGLAHTVLSKQVRFEQLVSSA